MSKTWIDRWVDEHCGGDRTLRMPPREWGLGRHEGESFAEYVAWLRYHYSLSAQTEFDVPPDQFVGLVSNGIVAGTLGVSEIVLNTVNGPVRVRARDQHTALVTLYTDGHAEYGLGAY